MTTHKRRKPGRPAGITRPMLPQTTVSAETLAYIESRPEPRGHTIDAAIAALKREEQPQ